MKHIGCCIVVVVMLVVVGMCAVGVYEKGISAYERVNTQIVGAGH